MNYLKGAFLFYLKTPSKRHLKLRKKMANNIEKLEKKKTFDCKIKEILKEINHDKNL